MKHFFIKSTFFTLFFVCFLNPLAYAVRLGDNADTPSEAPGGRRAASPLSLNQERRLTTYKQHAQTLGLDVANTDMEALSRRVNVDVLTVDESDSTIITVAMLLAPFGELSLTGKIGPQGITAMVEGLSHTKSLIRIVHLDALLGIDMGAAHKIAAAFQRMSEPMCLTLSHLNIDADVLITLLREFAASNHQRSFVLSDYDQGIDDATAASIHRIMEMHRTSDFVSPSSLFSTEARERLERLSNISFI